MSVETLEMGFLGVRETLSGLEADGKLVKGTAVAAEVKKISERITIQDFAVQLRTICDPVLHAYLSKVANTDIICTPYVQPSKERD